MAKGKRCRHVGTQLPRTVWKTHTAYMVEDCANRCGARRTWRAIPGGRFMKDWKLGRWRLPEREKEAKRVAKSVKEAS